MHVVIASRIHSPEPSAASFMLDAFEKSLVRHGHTVTVLTVKPPRGVQPRDPDGVRVKRASVLRDSSGYVRGYLPYLSYDVKLAFRVMFTRRGDLYFVEPPPTTGAVIRVACAILRRPYIYKAADIWSDAAALATTSRVILWLVRKAELFALRGARHAVAVSNGVADRMREIGVKTETTVVRFGADSDVFRFGEAPAGIGSPFFIYAGTYSEWQGAGIFVDAFARFVGAHPEYRLVFVGNGSDRGVLEAKKAKHGLPGVEFMAPIDGVSLNRLFAGASASLVSLKPGQGYDYAFPSKIYSSIAAGCPVVYAGVGPAVEFIRSGGAPDAIGKAVEYDVDAVAEALSVVAEQPATPEGRRELSLWAAESCSMAAAVETVVMTSEAVVAARSARTTGS